MTCFILKTKRTAPAVLFFVTLAHMFDHMFHVPIPILEKILRPIMMYLVLIIFLRAFGKRELAQINPFDLVVLLTLSNTVQNAIIGEDNSVLGGIIGAFSLLGINWILNRVLFRAPKVWQVFQGKPAVLIREGKVQHKALKQEVLTEQELTEILHKQQIHSPDEVKRCELEPSGNFFIEKMDDATTTAHYRELIRKIDDLTREVKRLKAAS